VIPTTEEIVRELDWIPLKRYLAIFEESKAAVAKRIAAGYWKAGKQYSRPEGAGLWISLKGVNAWAARHEPEKT
jgi:hypothetical protein